MHPVPIHRTGGSIGSQRNLLLLLACVVFLFWFFFASKASTTISDDEKRKQQHGDDAGGDVAGSESDHVLAQLMERARNMTRRYQPQRPHSALVQTLILVCGHATYSGSDYNKYIEETSWALEGFQKGKGLINAIAAHMKRGAELALQQIDSPTDRAALIISGGQTRSDSSSRSEAQSYLDVMLSNAADFPKQFNRLLDATEGGSSGQLDRYVFTEEHARDSYENVLFSLCRFYEAYGHFPKQLVIIGFEYKRRRFEELHRTAIRWPISRFKYIGVDAAASGQQKPLSDARSYEAAKKDMYMCSINAGTRSARNPNSRGIPYYTSVPLSVVKLLVHCGPKLFSEPLPWFEGDV